jgi:cell shape-determining protein MreC
VLIALVFGLCAAIALWAFEFGKDIAGLERGVHEQLQQSKAEIQALQTEISSLKEARNKAQSVANTAETLLITEKMAQEKLVALNQQLASENQRLKDDLGFFEQLIPATGGSGVAIRQLQAEVLKTGELKWQVLVIQAGKNPPDFSGQLTLTFTGLRHGQPWSADLPNGALSLSLRQYGRLQGVFQAPADVVLKGVSAKVLDGKVVRAAHAVRL